MSPDVSRPPTEHPSALPRGTRLGEFELQHVLGIGGFGIVYLAFDHALEREVAVKEYMPASLVGRTETLHVSLRSQSDAETFALGLRSFVNEARLLARFDHPSLLKVHRFWEANGTAYMAMPVLRGRTLKELRAGMQQPPDEAWLRALLLPLLGAIERLHSEGVFHRDIAPDNIQIEADGRPVLMDFGAARRVITDKSQNLTAILKPAYAPIEQYAEIGSVRQGPWTDLYALGATLHYLLLGRPPSPSTARAVHDDVTPLAGQGLPGCSDSFLHVVDWMLAPRPTDRPQSVAALRDVLEGRAPAPLRRGTAAAMQSDWDRTIIVAGAPRGPGSPASATSAPRLSAAPLPASALPAGDDSLATIVTPSALAATGSPSAKSKLLPVAVGLAVLVVVGLIGGVALWPVAPKTPAREPAISSSATSGPGTAAPAPTAPGATADAPAAGSVAAQPVPPIASPAPLPSPAPAATPAPTAAATTATTPAPPPATTTATSPAPTPSTPPALTAKPATTTPPTDTARATPKPPATTRPASPTHGPTPGSVTTAQDPAPRPAESLTRPAGDTSRPTAVYPSNPTIAPAVPAEPTRPLASGPEATCGAMNPLRYFVCMERECLRGSNQAHSDCQKWRQSRPRDP